MDVVRHNDPGEKLVEPPLALASYNRARDHVGNTRIL